MRISLNRPGCAESLRFKKARLSIKHLFLFVAALLLAGTFQGCVFMQSTLPSDPPRAQPVVNSSDPVLSQRRILVVGEITKETAEKTIQELFYLDGQNDRPIDLYLLTPGGDIASAFSIENAMHLIRSRVNTYAFAECNSAGAMLLAAGTGERVAFPGAIIIIHGMVVRGRVPAEYRNGLQANYTAFWKARTKIPESWLPLPWGKKHIITAEQALGYGIIDRIETNRTSLVTASRQ